MFLCLAFNSARCAFEFWKMHLGGAEVCQNRQQQRATIFAPHLQVQRASFNLIRDLVLAYLDHRVTLLLSLAKLGYSIFDADIFLVVLLTFIQISQYMSLPISVVKHLQSTCFNVSWVLAFWFCVGIQLALVIEHVFQKHGDLLALL